MEGFKLNSLDVAGMDKDAGLSDVIIQSSRVLWWRIFHFSF
jgi:hypothetical protein